MWIRVFPDKPYTKKPLETRMGKGKGNPEGWVAVVKPGRVMFELEGVTVEIAQEKGIEAREVAEVIGRALTAKRPRTRYLVGTDAKIRGPVAKVMPDRLMDRAVARQLG